MNYCSRECQRSHWQKHKGECCLPAPAVSVHVSDPATRIIKLLQNPSLTESEVTVLASDSSLPEWGWDVLDSLVECLRYRHLQPAVLRLLHCICEVCAPSEVFLSLICHLTSPDQYVGIDFKKELLSMITSLLPRVKSIRRLIDFVDQLYPALVSHLHSRQESECIDEYEAFFQACVCFADTLAALSTDVQVKETQCRVLLLQHQFQLDNLRIVQEVSSALISGLNLNLSSAQAEVLLEQKASNWSRQGLILYLSFLRPSTLYPVELLSSSNPLVFARGYDYTQALIPITESSEAVLWPLVNLLLVTVCKLEDRDQRRRGVGLLQAALDRPSDGMTSLSLLQRAIKHCQVASVTALLIHQYKEHMRVGLDYLDSANESSVNSRVCFTSEAAARWIFSCLKVEDNLDYLIDQCDVFCAALNVYRFVLLRDCKNATKLQQQRRQDYHTSVEPLLLAVARAQHAIRKMPETSLSQLRFPESVSLARLEMVDDIGRRVAEIAESS